MASLSGNSISNTYEGLLKLEDSTSGITTNPQNITDGLGNPTGLKLSTNYLQSPSQQSFQPLGHSKGGPGIRSSGTGNLSVTTNQLIVKFFRDKGQTYSGITFRVGVAETGDASVDCAFYSVGHSATFGLTPKDLIMSGFGLSNSDLLTTGLKTIPFPSPLTFPDSGVYCMAILIQSSNQPVFRTLSEPLSVANVFCIELAEMYGYVLNVAGTGFESFARAAQTNTITYDTNGPFLSSYDPEIIGGETNTTNNPILGFVLDK